MLSTRICTLLPEILPLMSGETVRRKAAPVLERLAAELEQRMAEQSLNQSMLYVRTGGQVHRDTISNILRAHDCKVSTLAQLAEALGCRISIRIEPAA